MEWTQNTLLCFKISSPFLDCRLYSSFSPPLHLLQSPSRNGTEWSCVNAILPNELQGDLLLTSYSMFAHAVRKGRLDLVLLIYVHIIINSTDGGSVSKHSGQIVSRESAVRAGQVLHHFILLYDFLPPC